MGGEVWLYNFIREATVTSGHIVEEHADSIKENVYNVCNV